MSVTSCSVSQERSVTYHLFAVIAALALLAMPRFVVSAGIRADTVLVDTNRIRSTAGAPPLHMDTALTAAAQQRAEEILTRQHFAHERPNGTSFATAAQDARYPFSRVAENLAIAFTAEDPLMRAWDQSPDHRRNLWNTQYTDTGIGIASGDFAGIPTIVVVQMFGERQAPNLRLWHALPSGLHHA
ncbi:CAP domain-containing protein [Candidatus Uhrbacteria bacterium]|nr:CAP domain-containing protein [Candidatus Uhrbacteria bacterium]